MAELNTQTSEKTGAKKSPGKYVKSDGERLFDRTVYTGIGFGVNEASSMLIADQFMDGKNLLEKFPKLRKMGSWFSKEGYERTNKWLVEKLKITDKIVKDAKTGAEKLVKAEARAGNSVMMVMLISGGTLLILPMKWMEDNKIKLVTRANHLMDKIKGKNLTTEETQTRDVQVAHDIACTPRQSWPTMLLGRTIAVETSIATGTKIGPERNDKLKDWSENFLTRSIQPPGQKNRTHRLAALAIVETYSCLISSVVLEFTSKFFAKHYSKPHNPELCNQPLPTATATAPVSTQSDHKPSDCTTCRHAEKIIAQKEQAASQQAAVQI